MNAWFWIIPAAVGLLGLTFVVGGAVYMFRGRLFKGGRGIIGGLVFVGIALIVGLVALNIQTYNRLTYERPVAIISARQVSPQLFSVTMCEPGAKIREFDVNGDQWRLEAYVLKWQPWANVLGLDSQFQLDRLTGRYLSARQEAEGARSVHELRTPEEEPTLYDATSWGELFTKGINIFSLPPPLRQYAPAVDTTYGNGLFVNMRDGSVHRVWMTQDAMIARVGEASDLENCRNGEMPNAPAPADAPAQLPGN